MEVIIKLGYLCYDCGDIPVICARCIFLRCFTVISRMSAFSSLECLELCVKIRIDLDIGGYVMRFISMQSRCNCKNQSDIQATYIFFQSIQD